MLTAILAVRNLFGEHHDLWAINADDEYHEEGGDGDADFEGEVRELQRTQPSVPTQARTRPGR